MSSDSVNVYNREKLYEEVWNAPVIRVAEKYGVSDVAIHKICKSMNIPTPPNGYWTKLKFGKEVKKEPLPPEHNGQSIKYGIKPIDKEVKNIEISSPLSFLSLEEQEMLYDVASTLKVDLSKSLCKEIQEYKKVVSEWNKNNESIEGRSTSYSDYIYRHSYENHKYVGVPVLAGVISKDGLIRIYNILNSLINGLKKLGYSVNEDMTFCIRGERVKFEIYEKQDKIDHVLTAKEEKDLKKYEEDIKRNRWAMRPVIPTYEYRFNGKLLFSTKKATYIKDTDKSSIDDRISDMLIQLVQQSEVVRIERETREEEQRKRDEEKRQREMVVERHNSEIEKLALLLQESDDFDRATKIRNYIKAVEDKDASSKNEDWIIWAKDKADWYDPTIEKSDMVFGIRVPGSEVIPKKMESRHWW